MIRNTTKLTALAAIALLGGATALNCSKGTTQGQGDMELAFNLPDGTSINSVSYQVLSSASATIASGTINTSDKNATVSLDLSLAPGTGDTVSLTATTSAGVACTGASAPFNVVSGQVTMVNLTLTCGGTVQSTAPGQVGITANVVEGDNCPSISSSVAAPAQTSVGGTISVNATATDPDATDMITYAWAPAASFANPNVAAATYSCTAAGTQTITLTISDNHSPTPCTTQITMTVNCVNGSVCGNGIVEAGETCDPPNGTTCSATCQTIGGTGGTSGAAGAPATGGTSGAAGAPATGGTSGAAGAPATGGTTGTGGTGVFTQDNAACESCELSGTSNGVCFNTSTPSGGTSTANFGCDSFTNATDKANCLALVGCLRSTACQQVIAAAGSDYGESGVNNDDGTPCLCDSATTTVAKATCLTASSWTGVCAAQFVAASNNSSSNSNPPTALFDPTFPVGVAMNLMTCDIDSSQTGSGTPSCTSAATCKVPQ